MDSFYSVSKGSWPNPASPVPVPRWCGGTGPSSNSACDITASVAESIRPSRSECRMYEAYTRLPDLSAAWHARIWPEWANETSLRPALHALELTFRMIYSLACDARPYVDKDEWMKRLESLAGSEVEVIALLCEGDAQAPTTADLPRVNGAEVHVVSQDSILARLACCDGEYSEARQMVYRIQLGVECHMWRAPFTLGLGEPNLSGKPILRYDAVCNPAHVYQIKPRGYGGNHPEDHTLCTVHQIVECWMAVSQSLLERIDESVVYMQDDLAEVARLSWIIERIWKIASSAMSLLILMDPNDFMKLKQHLAIDLTGSAYCLRSHRLQRVTEACKVHLRRLVPKVVGVEADPKGGPRLQEAVMDLLLTHGGGGGSNGYGAASSANIHVLQAFQSIEMSVRQFYFSYQQLVVSVMGSVEFKASTASTSSMEAAEAAISVADVISEIYLEPSYFPSLDGAKIFLGDYWHHQHGAHQGEPLIGHLNQRLDQNHSVSSGMWTDSSESGSSLLSQEASNPN